MLKDLGSLTEKWLVSVLCDDGSPVDLTLGELRLPRSSRWTRSRKLGSVLPVSCLLPALSPSCRVPSSVCCRTLGQVTIHSAALVGSFSGPVWGWHDSVGPGLGIPGDEASVVDSSTLVKPLVPNSAALVLFGTNHGGCVGIRGGGRPWALGPSPMPSLALMGSPAALPVVLSCRENCCSCDWGRDRRCCQLEVAGVWPLPPCLGTEVVAHGESTL